MKILVTGGCGFIGSNFIKLILNEHKDVEIVNFDKLTYAGNIKNLDQLKNNVNYSFVKGDISLEEDLVNIISEKDFDFIVNFAAESHVDRSIADPSDFLKTNILGTYTLLNLANKFLKKNQNFKFIHISTDEVYGALKIDDQPFSEKSQYLPNSPYSASKASSDHLVRAWHHTYGLNTIITNCSNNYGPFQHREKLIPLTIINAIKGKEITIYGDGSNIRDWLYVDDHCKAILKVMNHGEIGETYNIGGSNEISNLEVVKKICSILQKKLPPSDNERLKTRIEKYEELITFVNDRPGHDFRYAINQTKIEKDLSWYPIENFDSGIEKTVDWYLLNLDQISSN